MSASMETTGDAAASEANSAGSSLLAWLTTTEPTQLMAATQYLEQETSKPVELSPNEDEVWKALQEEDDYDPRNPQYIQPASSSEVMLERLRLLRSQIGQLKAAISLRESLSAEEQCEEVLNHYRHVLTDFLQEEKQLVATVGDPDDHHESDQESATTTDGNDGHSQRDGNHPSTGKEDDASPSSTASTAAGNSPSANLSTMRSSSLDWKPVTSGSESEADLSVGARKRSVAVLDGGDSLSWDDDAEYDEVAPLIRMGSAAKLLCHRSAGEAAGSTNDDVEMTAPATADATTTIASNNTTATATATAATNEDEDMALLPSSSPAAPPPLDSSSLSPAAARQKEPLQRKHRSTSHEETPPPKRQMTRKTNGIAIMTEMETDETTTTTMSTPTTVSTPTSPQLPSPRYPISPGSISLSNEDGGLSPGSASRLRRPKVPPCGAPLGLGAALRRCIKRQKAQLHQQHHKQQQQQHPNHDSKQKLQQLQCQSEVAINNNNNKKIIGKPRMGRRATRTRSLVAQNLSPAWRRHQDRHPSPEEV